MKIIKFIIPIILLFTACSTYKQLKPDPKLEAKEQGYLPVKDDDENFVLKGNKKFYIEFPKPLMGNFYLILSSPLKNRFDTYLTDFFDDGEGEIKKIKNDYELEDSLWVYRISTDKEKYYWVIEKVNGEETPLVLNYRYAPIWRFKFELKYAEYKKRLLDNTTDKDVYNSINLRYNFSNVNFKYNYNLADSKLKALQDITKELEELENIFPDELLNSSDPAYLNYIELKKNVNNEISFNKKYSLVFKAFDAINKNNFNDFFERTDEILEILNEPSKFTTGITERIKYDVSNKANKFVNYVNDLLQSKNDINPINFPIEVNKIDKLFTLSTNDLPNNYDNTINYLTKFNYQAQKLEEYYSKESELKEAFKKTPTYPDNNFYPKMLKLIKEMKNVVPDDKTANIPNFRALRVTINMTRAIESAYRNVTRLELGFQIAEILVPKINQAKSEGRYKDIINMLISNRELDYLINQYPDIDRIYLEQQRGLIKSNMTRYGFARSESLLKNLFNDNDFVDARSISGRKQQIIEECEDELYESVKRVSKTAVDSFVSRNKMTIKNVRALYADSSFSPAYVLTFSSKGTSVVSSRNNEIQNYLDNMKFNELPEGAISGIYNDFLKNINNLGVEKLRAIVEHGKYYKGNNKTIKNIIAESDINVPKTINKPMDYREVYVLPVTSNKNGDNEYMFRILLNIPSDAQFPVFDVNIKLPVEIAKNAAGKQWYDQITINNKIIKNEGRVKITAPMASNNYEAQISPVQMDKGGKNVLEVRFKYPAFKVFKVSVMAQKPIIKKN